MITDEDTPSLSSSCRPVHLPVSSASALLRHMATTGSSLPPTYGDPPTNPHLRPRRRPRITPAAIAILPRPSYLNGLPRRSSDLRRSRRPLFPCCSSSPDPPLAAEATGMAAAEMLPAVSLLQVEGTVFHPTVRPPGSSNTLFLAGAGARGLEIDGKFVKFTAIGVYMEAAALPSLAPKWKGRSSDELAESGGFFRDIVTGPFEKFTRVTMILPLTGQQYSEKVAENCVAYWKSVGVYTDAEADAVEKFKAAFAEEVFPPGASILFTQSPSGRLTIAFSEDGAVPELGKTVIENRAMSEAVLESIVGRHGVSPEAKKSLASRVSQLLGAYSTAETVQAEDAQEKDRPEPPEKVVKTAAGERGPSCAPAEE